MEKNKTGLTVRPLKETEIDEVLDIVANAFYEKEPLIGFLNIEYEDVVVLCREFVFQSLYDRLCLVCVDDKGKILGATLARDLRTEVDYELVPKSLEPILHCLGELVDKYLPLKIKGVDQGEGVEIFMTGVCSEARGKGVGRFLINEASNYFKKLGYKLSITESTSPITQSIRTQYGFNVLGKMEYASFQYNGKNIFKDLETSSYITKKKLFDSRKPGAALLIAYHNAA